MYVYIYVCGVYICVCIYIYIYIYISIYIYIYILYIIFLKHVKCCFRCMIIYLFNTYLFAHNIYIYIYIYAFSRRFYPKRLTVHYTWLYIFYQYVCSLGIEPTTFALLTQCSTTEPQEYSDFFFFKLWFKAKLFFCTLNFASLIVLKILENVSMNAIFDKNNDQHFLLAKNSYTEHPYCLSN